MTKLEQIIQNLESEIYSDGGLGQRNTAPSSENEREGVQDERNTDL